MYEFLEAGSLRSLLSDNETALRFGWLKRKKCDERRGRRPKLPAPWMFTAHSWLWHFQQKYASRWGLWWGSCLRLRDLSSWILRTGHRLLAPSDIIVRQIFKLRFIRQNAPSQSIFTLFFYYYCARACMHHGEKWEMRRLQLWNCGVGVYHGKTSSGSLIVHCHNPRSAA